MYRKSVSFSLSGNTQGKTIKVSFFLLRKRMETSSPRVNHEQERFSGNTQDLPIRDMTYISILACWPNLSSIPWHSKQYHLTRPLVALPSLYTQLMSEERSLSSRLLSLGSELPGLTWARPALSSSVRKSNCSPLCEGNKGQHYLSYCSQPIHPTDALNRISWKRTTALQTSWSR